ncbi:MAG TPA: hypothetical protein VLV55_10470 [Rhizomicrobium sp.]|nr:hypothetical protein [Rhizomicrobium sp.]
MSLGLLVGRFGTFVRGNCAAPVEAGPSTEASCSDDIEHLRAFVAHHLIPLMLLSKVDGSSVPAEQKIIVDHCVAMAKRHEIAVSESGRAAFAAYVADYRPSLMQLDPALRLLERDSLEDLAELFATASAVISADGQIAPAELRLLEEIKQEATRLAAAA